MNTSPIVISDTIIHQDSEGRYCLNDLHQAAGGDSKFRPTFFFRLDSTKALIEQLRCADMHTLNPIEIIQGKGKIQGTFVVKELVYAYAMWISAEFMLKVIRTYDAVANNQPTITQEHLQYLVEQIKPLLNTSLKHGLWEPEEIALLEEKRAEGWGGRRIARLLNRSYDSVGHKVRTLAKQALESSHEA